MQIVIHDDVMVDNFDGYVMMIFGVDECVVDDRLTTEKRKAESSMPMNLQLIVEEIIMQV